MSSTLVKCCCVLPSCTAHAAAPYLPDRSVAVPAEPRPHPKHTGLARISVRPAGAPARRLLSSLVEIVYFNLFGERSREEPAGLPPRQGPRAAHVSLLLAEVRQRNVDDMGCFL